MKEIYSTIPVFLDPRLDNLSINYRSILTAAQQLLVEPPDQSRLTVLRGDLRGNFTDEVINDAARLLAEGSDGFAWMVNYRDLEGCYNSMARHMLAYFEDTTAIDADNGYTEEAHCAARLIMFLNIVSTKQVAVPSEGGVANVPTK